MGIMSRDKDSRTLPGLKKQSPKNRDYRREWLRYDSKPSRMKARAARGRARYAAMKKGLVKKYDGKDIDHINSNPMDNNPNNLRVRDARANRSFARTRTAREKRV